MLHKQVHWGTNAKGVHTGVPTQLLSIKTKANLKKEQYNNYKVHSRDTRSHTCCKNCCNYMKKRERWEGEKTRRAQGPWYCTAHRCINKRPRPVRGSYLYHTHKGTHWPGNHVEMVLPHWLENNGQRGKIKTWRDVQPPWLGQMGLGRGCTKLTYWQSESKKSTHSIFHISTLNKLTVYST